MSTLPAPEGVPTLVIPASTLLLWQRKATAAGLSLTQLLTRAVDAYAPSPEGQGRGGEARGVPLSAADITRLTDLVDAHPNLTPARIAELFAPGASVSRLRTLARRAGGIRRARVRVPPGRG